MDTSVTNPSSLEWRDEPLEMAVVNQQLLSGLGAAWAALRGVTAGLLVRGQDQSLTLRYGGQVLRFPTPNEFAFALTTRVGLPSQRIAGFERYSSRQLRETVDDIRRLEVEFAQVLSQAKASGASVRELLAAFETKTFTKDHEWRALFSALADSEDSTHDPYRRVAVEKYGQYLVSRRNALQEIRIARQASSRKRSPRARSRNTPYRFAGPQHIDRRGGQWPLPKGTPIGIDLLDPAPIRATLAAYEFRIEQEAGRVFITDTNAGTTYALHAGRNTIGRAPRCDIVVDRMYREISRVHVVIDVVDSRTLVMTDQSAHGTSISSARVMGA